MNRVEWQLNEKLMCLDANGMHNMVDNLQMTIRFIDQLQGVNDFLSE